MELIDLVSARIERYEVPAWVATRTPDVRPSRDGRGMDYLWTESDPADGQTVAAVSLIVSHDKGMQRYVATVQAVSIERDRGMTITRYDNLVMNPRSRVASERQARFNRAKLDAFTASAVDWAKAGAPLEYVPAA